MKIRGRRGGQYLADVVVSAVSCAALLCMAGCGNDTNLTTIHYLPDNTSDFYIDDTSSQNMAETAENPVIELSENFFGGGRAGQRGNQ
jgi:hypothetical protein